MAVYSQYASSCTNGSSVVANEAYDGAIGAYQMMEESETNTHRIFEAIIGRDFMETYNALDESVVTESELMAVNEASVSEIWEKVKAFIKKIWEKLLGILKNIKTKIESVFIRDGKELVKKYEKEINKKANSGQLTKLKFKWKKLKNADVFSDTIGTNLEDMLLRSDLATEMKNNLLVSKKFKQNAESERPAGSFQANGRAKVDYAKDSESISKVNDDRENEGMKGIRPYTSDEISDMIEDALGKIVQKTGGSSGAVSIKEFSKDFHDAVFEDEETIEDGQIKFIDEAKESLMTGKKVLKSIDDAKKAVDKSLKDYHKKADDIAKAMQRRNSDKDTQNTYAAASNRLAGRTNTCCNILSKVTGMAFAQATSCAKEYLKECRALWIKAATWNQKNAYEESAMLEAVQEVSDYEVEEMFS